MQLLRHIPKRDATSDPVLVVLLAYIEPCDSVITYILHEDLHTSMWWVFQLAVWTSRLLGEKCVKYDISPFMKWICEMWYIPFYEIIMRNKAGSEHLWLVGTVTVNVSDLLCHAHFLTCLLHTHNIWIVSQQTNLKELQFVVRIHLILNHVIV